MGLFVKVKLCRSLAKGKAHVNYIAFRSRETREEERGAFDQKRDRADVRKFNERLEDHLTRHPMANKAYKITISLSEREFAERGLTSWKPIVREAMDNLQRKWAREFKWIASEHMAKGHPHVHVVVKATCCDESGRRRQLRLDKDQLKDMKKEIGRCLDRQRPREPQREISRSRPGHILSLADGLFQAFQRALRNMEAQQREQDAMIEREFERNARRRSDDDRGR